MRGTCGTQIFWFDYYFWCLGYPPLVDRRSY